MLEGSAMDAVKESAKAWLAHHRGEISQWHRTIWELAEPAWREYESAQWYVDTLRRHDFTVEKGSGGMPTAFHATWSNGDGGSGPRLLAYAEYDAVPGNCQAATTERRPRSGLSVHAAGHTDPHSALGISTLAGALAVQAAMRQHAIPGTLVYTGEPAEKVQGSKVVHGIRGYYDEVDAILSFHPFYMLPLCNTVRWDTHCGAYYSIIYTFECDEPESWGHGDLGSPIPASHAAARAPGADAALFAMYTLTKTTQDSMIPLAGGWSLSEAILTAGQATADNLPASIAQVQYSWRVPDVASAEAILAVMNVNAEAAARVSHCRLRSDWVARNRPGLANHTLAEVTWQNMRDVGAPQFGAEAVEVAQSLQEAIGLEPDEDPFLPETRTTIAPWEAEEKLRRHLPPEQLNWTSDDYVEMTWYAPTARFYVARPALAVGAGQPGYPAWVMNALGGIPATIDPMIHTAAQIVAGTLLDLFRSPDTLARAKVEHLRRRSEAGQLSPLVPKDFEPPIDFRWPEYVSTARGREWWIPTTAKERET
jgi:aminobenzoyl-glutamate utilization protein B